MLDGYLPSLLDGLKLSVGVALASLAIAVVLGFVGALAKLSGNAVARAVAGLYTSLVRGVPDLVLMLLVFFGGQIAVNAVSARWDTGDVVDIDPFTAGVVTLGFIFGAYLTETFRGAILAIAPGQIEAGRAFGLSESQVFRRITLPQMLRLALPGFTNNWLVLMKSTALVSVIGLNDVMQRAGQAAGATRRPFTFYLAAGVFYLAITAVSVAVLRIVEARSSLGVPKAAR
jgi:arginine/ornithine transport system permease protein